jgi:dienelactone hydrolase
MSDQPPAYAFGHWPSSISSESVAEGALRFGRIQLVDDAVYWSEGRPSENGRTPVMRWSPGKGIAELIPPPFSARSRVHEYGGGEFLAAGGVLYFVNDADQDVYGVSADSAAAAAEIRRFTNRPDLRFADFAFDASQDRLIAVGERQCDHDHALPENGLWGISIGSADPDGNGTLLQKGHSFYASPRLNADGSKLCFLAWDLPEMPWDAAALYVSEIASDGSLKVPNRIAGGNGSACFQPEWGPDGALYFVWDIDGFGNLFRWQPGHSPLQVTHLQAEMSKPLWSFNATSCGFLSPDRVYVSFSANGEQASAIYDLDSQAITPRSNGLTSIQSLAVQRGRVGLVAMTAREPLCVSIEDVEASAGKLETPPTILRRSSEQAFDSAYISEARRLSIPKPSGETAFGFYYGPANPHARAPDSSLPPLIINLHGGPTSSAARGLKPRTLFFTSRGFAWLDLDYSGSTGYGRAYRDRLKGQWGVQDVEDTIAAAGFAAACGLADRTAIFITGGSAGGYTVLMAVATSNLFCGAASYYGICDLVALQHTTHKFEQGYQSTLLGAALEEDEALYRNRSALSHVNNIRTPLILFQGADDRVVPKEQSERIANALRQNGLPVEYHEFEGEGHGFRRADTIRRSLELELGFYARLMEAKSR